MALLVRRNVVAHFDLLRDILIGRHLFLIFGHLAFSADTDRFDSDFSTSSMPVDGYPNLHTHLSCRALHSLFDSSIDRFVDYSDNRYSSSGKLSRDILFADSPFR